MKTIKNIKINKPSSKNHPLIETYDHEYKGNVQTVRVAVSIDYVDGTISLIDHGTRRKKEFIFAKRGLEYMKSWQDILDAMKSAISDATAKLESYKEAKTMELAEKIIE